MIAEYIFLFISKVVPLFQVPLFLFIFLDENERKTWQHKTMFAL